MELRKNIIFKVFHNFKEKNKFMDRMTNLVVENRLHISFI